MDRTGQPAVADPLERAPTSTRENEQTSKPPDDLTSNHLRFELVLWGGPLGWPSLVEVGLRAGGKSWTTWLMAASTEDLAGALEAAQHAPAGQHPDPRCRLAHWAIDARYPTIALEDGRPLGPGYETWERFLEEADNGAIDMALRATRWPIPSATAEGSR